ncbi:hypothetical protein ASA1KI_03180 [Opitutales bacterium ASA1]|uniref:hypothetical protein n=1 Tax=Congregicoccus parvus TaxID=3081749 RepID=UPI002B2FD257|nr:hypothetical protein ASA1KI_03180 [Opitutales bacterium ASA1]
MSSTDDADEPRERNPISARALQAEDYIATTRLWEESGCGPASGADDLAALALFLGQNPELSTAAESEGRIVGVLLCGEDGRAGFVHRVSVASGVDAGPVVEAMLRRCLLKLRSLGVNRCYLLCDHGCPNVEIGRAARSGLGEAVASLSSAALRGLDRAQPRPTEPGLACEVIVPRKRK